MNRDWNKSTTDRLDNLLIEEGDIFNDRLSYFIYVCREREDEVKIVESWGSELRNMCWINKKDLQHKLSYKNIPGYHVVYMGNDKKCCAEILTQWNEVFGEELGIID
jgi:hypothetical protein